MHESEVSGMTCGHCEAAVTRAVRSVDATAAVVLEHGADPDLRALAE